MKQKNEILNCGIIRVLLILREENWILLCIRDNKTREGRKSVKAQTTAGY
jgi:hypothetical protein